MDYLSYKNDVWNTCLRQFKVGVQKGLQFAAAGKREDYHRVHAKKEEVAINSRYLHRGFYCPSPAFHFILANSRRGRILLHPTKRSKITHRYFYNANDEIYAIQYFVEGSLSGCEYIEWHDYTKYGFVFSNSGILGGISIEIYKGSKLQSYMWARCHNASLMGDDWQADYVHYETYDYDDWGLSEFDLHFVALIEEELNDVTDALDLVNHEKYFPVYESGVLVGFKRVRGQSSKIDSIN